LIGPKPGQAKGNSESEVLVVKATKSLFIPQVATIVEGVVFRFSLFEFFVYFRPQAFQLQQARHQSAHQ